MEPGFHKGDVVIIGPNLSPQPGDFFIAKRHLGAISRAISKVSSESGFRFKAVKRIRQKKKPVN